MVYLDSKEHEKSHINSNWSSRLNTRLKLWDINSTYFNTLPPWIYALSVHFIRSTCFVQLSNQPIMCYVTVKEILQIPKVSVNIHIKCQKGWKISVVLTMAWFVDDRWVQKLLLSSRLSLTCVKTKQHPVSGSCAGGNALLMPCLFFLQLPSFSACYSIRFLFLQSGT